MEFQSCPACSTSMIGSHLSIPMDIDGVICNGFSDSKVDDLELPFDQDEICRLEIRMHDVLVMYGLYRFQHL